MILGVAAVVVIAVGVRAYLKASELFDRDLERDRWPYEWPVHETSEGAWWKRPGAHK